MHTEHVPEDRTEQIILYVRLYQEQQRVSTPPYRQEQIARITARIISTVFGPHPDVFLGSHARMMAEYAKIADMLPQRREDRSA